MTQVTFATSRMNSPSTIVDGEACKTARVASFEVPQATKPLSREVHLLSQEGKPLLALPKLGVFALYYILDKLGIFAEGAKCSYAKKEIEENRRESEKAHKGFLEEMKKAIAEKEETERWGVAVQVISWIGSLVSIVSGAILIATGVGAVGGALLIAGGVLTLSNQLMEVFGGWKKIVKLLPGDDPEAKRAILTWIQIGITVLALILSGSGIVFGGFASIGESLGTAMNMMGAVAAVGSGVATIGMGIHDSSFRESMAKSQRRKTEHTKLKHTREDLMEKMEGAPERLEGLFRSLATNLGLLEEINTAHQQAWR